MVSVHRIRRFQHHLRVKFFTISLLLVALPSLVIGLVGFQESKQQLNTFGEVSLKNSVRFTISLIQTLDDEVKKGTLTREDAQERVKQAMLGPKDQTGKRPINKQYDLGENGYLSAFGKDGIQVVHPKLEGQNVLDLKDKEGKPFVKELIEKGINGGGFTTYYWTLPNDDQTLAPKIVYTELDPRWGWVISAGTYLADFNKGASNVLNLLLFTLGLFLLGGALVVWLFSNHIIRPIVHLSGQVVEVANGNLQVELRTMSRQDEIGHLNKAFNQMVDHLREMLREVRDSSELVAAASEELMASAEQSAKASEHIALTAHEITESTKLQASSLTEGMAAAHTLAKGIEAITSHAEQMAGSATQTTAVAVEGNTSIQKAVSQMNTIHSTILVLEQLIRGLGERSNQIGHIVEVISRLSEQTNLLSLNAAIEAARAGEQGRGFAVVADEVRKLAAQSAESAKQITNLIQGIQEQTAKAVDTMEKGSKEFALGIEVVNEAGASFDHITSAVTVVTNQIDQVLASSTVISEETKSILAFMQTISQAAHANSLSTDHVSAATEQQLATMEEISTSSMSLAKRAEELRAVLERFERHI